MISTSRALLLVAVLSLFPASGQPTGNPDVPAIIAATKPSVVTIHTFGRDGGANSTATGFFVSSNLVATCCHVLDGAFGAQVRLADGSRKDVIELVDEDRGSDLALLRLAPETVGTAVRLADALPTEGEGIIVVGSPRGLDQTTTDGIVSAVREQEGARVRIQISAPVSHGSSGSPVLNTRGEVVGIASASMAEGQNLNFAVPIAELRRLDWGVGFRPDVRRAGIALSERAERIVTQEYRSARRIVIEAEARWEARSRDAEAFGESDRFLEAAQIAEAAECIERSSRFAPEDGRVWEYLGRARAVMARTTIREAPRSVTPESLRETAVRVVEPFERALAIDRNLYEVWTELGFWYMLAGRKADSERAYNEGLLAKVRFFDSMMETSKEHK